MFTKFGRVVIVVSLFIAATLVLSSSLSAQPADQPSVRSKPVLPRSFPAKSPAVTASATDAALERLSPDLREAARSQGGSEHLVYVLIEPGTQIEGLMTRAVTSRRLGELQWTTGLVSASTLIKLASAPGVLSVTSSEAFQPLPAPGLDVMTGQPPALTRARIEELLAKGGRMAVLQEAAPISAPTPTRTVPTLPTPASPDTIKVADIHRATEAHAAGYTGAGVIAAVIDTGVDFGTTELQGTQARVAGGAYDGWPYAYDTLSGLYYALEGITLGPDNFWSVVGLTEYAHTLPVEDASCESGVCVGELMLDYGDAVLAPVVLEFTWPDTSQSGNYYYTVYPDFWHLNAGYLRGLGYASLYGTAAAVLVVDETAAGRYDTVYIDADFDQDIGDEKPMTKGDELAGTDLYGADWSGTLDGLWDLSASMLTWIADGANPPPGVGLLYSGVAVPETGRLVSFVGDAAAHGTAVASMIAGQSVITDPYLLRQINPRFAGGAEAGGVGGPVMTGMAPDTHVAAFMNGFVLPFDAWTLAILGFDGVPQSGDEAQLINNSWGDSFVNHDGWDTTARFAQYLNINYAPNTMFLAATGNGGPGYGTTTTPNGGTIVKVGASTSYGSSTYWERVEPDQFTYGAIQPWSNRGPSGLGDVDPDLVCVGAWGFAATPLNRAFNGQGGYDLFGGTSMSSPVCTGVAAMSYQAFREAHNRWPTWQEAKDILTNGAHDLGYNALAQGAGNADAMRSAAIATGEALYVTPSQWQVGDYRGEILTPGFPAIVHPGDTVSAPLTFHNPMASPTASTLQDVTLQRVHEISFTVTLDAGIEDGVTPDYVRDISDLIDDYDPDLVSAHVMFPFTSFDNNADYYSDTQVTSLFYDWTDLNGDGNLWVDDNGNGGVDVGEIDRDDTTGFEYIRFSYANASANYQLIDLGRDALSRRHDGVFFGLQRYYGTTDVTVTVHMILYRKADWEWLSLSSSSVNVPAGGEVTVTATMAVPTDARVGLYEGAIEYDGQVLPVIVHVAADSATFAFGAASLDETMGDTPYDSGHLLGSTDWAWRPETGDWKSFYYDVPDGTANAGTGMVVTTEWINPTAIEVPPLPDALLFESFSSGIPYTWVITETIGACLWTTTDAWGRENYTGGDGPAAIADSDYCYSGMDTYLYTPPIDLSGQDEAWLAFRTHFTGLTDWMNQPLEQGMVDVSTDTGSTWTTILDLQQFTWQPQVIDLTPYVGGEIQLRFRYVALEWAWWWQLDDVGVFTADPSPTYLVEPAQPTDVDTSIFGAAEDEFSIGDPGFFGPAGLEWMGGSQDLWLSGGTFAFGTATGGPREIVGGQIADGLGYVLLHNVLNSGLQAGEPVVGQAYQLSVAPAPLTIEADTVVSATPPTVRGELAATVEATSDIPEGVAMMGFGPSQPQAMTDTTIYQDSGVCSATWVEPIMLVDGGRLEATTTSDAVGLDIDLYLVIDDGNGYFTCSDSLVASSAGATADEFVSVTRPDDGQYFVVVEGYTVPGGASTFDITIRAIQGHNLTVTNAPAGPLTANTPLPFTVAADAPYEPGTTLEGLLFLGPSDVPTALAIPVTVTVPELDAGDLSARLTAAPESVAMSETTALSLWAWNHSSDAEVVSVTVDVPPGLIVDLGSISASPGQAQYSISQRRLSWSGIVAPSSGVTITFDAAAATHAGRVEVRAQVNGLLRDRRLQLTAPVWLNVDAPPRLIHMPVVAGN